MVAFLDCYFPFLGIPKQLADAKPKKVNVFGVTRDVAVESVSSVDAFIPVQASKCVQCHVGHNANRTVPAQLTILVMVSVVLGSEVHHCTLLNVRAVRLSDTERQITHCDVLPLVCSTGLFLCPFEEKLSYIGETQFIDYENSVDF